MDSSKPYILRALYEWIVDNECTPHLLIDATAADVEVPTQYVKDGQIVLNISPSAVVDLVMTNSAVCFRGRFGGVPTEVSAPVGSILGIYARENGQGMVFEPGDTPPDSGPGTPGDKPGGKRPALKIVK